MDQIETVITLFAEFLRDNYHDELLENVRKGFNYIEIDFMEIAKFSPEICDQLLDNAEETLKTFEISAQKVISPTHKVEDIKIRLKNISESNNLKIRNIRSAHIGKFISVEAVLKSRTSVRPQIENINYKCECGQKLMVIPKDFKIIEPKRCNFCGAMNKFVVLSKKWIDVQSLYFEEDINMTKSDPVPQSLNVLLKGDLTAKEFIADLIPPRNLKVTGIIKEVPIYMKTGNQSNKFDWYLEANNVELVGDSIDKLIITEEDIKEFESLSKNPNLIEDLTDSFAPNIYGHKKVKEGALLFLVKSIKLYDGDVLDSRDSFHMLLVGDPGCGKTDIAKEINRVSYKCKKAVGKGASGVGLTVSAEEDKLLGQRVLTPGLIPMCNEGHVVLDEVDKMDKEIHSHLLECMENGTIEIAKSKVYGIVNANVSIFMIANPKYETFDIYSPLVEQITLTQALLSRFDLIFPILNSDKIDERKKVYQKIKERFQRKKTKIPRKIEFNMMRKYLFYVSKNVHPSLTKEAEDIIDSYEDRMIEYDCKEFDGLSSYRNKVKIKITARQITSMYRLSIAYAKLRMSEYVTAEDAKRAVDIVEYYLTALAYDAKTGTVDIEKINSGMTESRRNNISLVRRIIINTLDAINNDGKNRPVAIEQIIESALKQGLTEEEVNLAIEDMKKKADIIESRSGFINKL